MHLAMETSKYILPRRYPNTSCDGDIQIPTSIETSRYFFWDIKKDPDTSWHWNIQIHFYFTTSKYFLVIRHQDTLWFYNIQIHLSIKISRCILALRCSGTSRHWDIKTMALQHLATSWNRNIKIHHEMKSFNPRTRLGTILFHLLKWSKHKPRCQESISIIFNAKIDYTNCVKTDLLVQRGNH